jgi:ParB-like chromosome segregation protein Spo0J
MQSILIPIKEVKLNPNNPRILKDDKFAKLKQSITDAPWMLEARPIVIDEANIVLGGNMRYQALKELGYKEIYCVRLGNLTAEQKKEFIIKDNVSFGEWDWEILANDWDALDLEAWGLDVPLDDPLPDLDETGEFEESKCIKITFKTLEDAQAAEAEVQELLNSYGGATYSFTK